MGGVLNLWNGHVKIPREIINNDIWKDVNAYRLFHFLILKATHKDIEINSIPLKRGEYLRSYSKLAEDLAYKEGRGIKKLSKSTINRAVNRLKEAGMLDTREPFRGTDNKTDSGTVFIVIQYEQYQGFEGYRKNNSGTDSDCSAEVKQESINKNKDNIVEVSSKQSIPFEEIINYLNEKCGTGYKASTKATRKLIKDRFKEGHKLEAFKKVIDIKSVEWLNNSEYSKYLRPITLFGTKFESYLNQKPIMQNISAVKSKEINISYE